MSKSDDGRRLTNDASINVARNVVNSSLDAQSLDYISKGCGYMMLGTLAFLWEK